MSLKPGDLNNPTIYDSTGRRVAAKPGDLSVLNNPKPPTRRSLRRLWDGAFNDLLKSKQEGHHVLFAKMQ